jgi:hypothetical protein
MHLCSRCWFSGSRILRFKINVADEYISKVQLGTINNTTTGGTGYSDYTSTSTNLTKGVSSTITITPTWPGTKYNDGYAVWIDYNKDGDFTMLEN